jgi:subtilase-type serine protease
VEGSRYVRDAALSRRAGAAAPGAEAATPPVPGCRPGRQQHAGRQHNTARTEANSNGLLVGIDREFGGWQVGVLAGTGRTDVKQQAPCQVEDRQHPLRCLRQPQLGRFGLRGGVAWSKHEVKSTRELAFAGSATA